MFPVTWPATRYQFVTLSARSRAPTLLFLSGRRERERAKALRTHRFRASPRLARSKTSFVDVIDRGLIAEIFHPILFKSDSVYPYDDTLFLYSSLAIFLLHYTIQSLRKVFQRIDSVRFRARRVFEVFPSVGQSRSAGEINRVRWWSISGYAFDSVNGEQVVSSEGQTWREPTPGFRERFVMDDRRYTEKWWWMKSRPRINIGRNLLHTWITCDKLSRRAS